MNIVLELIDKYWKFDDNQQPMSSWHDKQDLLKAIEHEFQLNKTCSKCVSLCKNTKSKYKHDKFYCLDTGSFIANKDEHTCEAFSMFANVLRLGEGCLTDAQFSLGISMAAFAKPLLYEVPTYLR